MANKNTEFPESHNHHMQTLQECMSVCSACAKKCLEKGHQKTAALCAECSDVCALAIKAASGRSNFENEIMELCAAVCSKCAQECKKASEKHCEECSEVCKRCAEACSKAPSPY